MQYVAGGVLDLKFTIRGAQLRVHDLRFNFAFICFCVSVLEVRKSRRRTQKNIFKSVIGGFKFIVFIGGLNHYD